jgi:hypothetical protein
MLPPHNQGNYAESRSRKKFFRWLKKHKAVVAVVSALTVLTSFVVKETLDEPVPTENLRPAFVKRCHSTRSQMFAVRLGKVRMLNEIRRAQSAKGNEDPQLQTRSRTHEVTEQDDHGQEYYRNGREEQVSKLLVFMDARGFDDGQVSVIHVDEGSEVIPRRNGLTSS